MSEQPVTYWTENINHVTVRELIIDYTLQVSLIIIIIGCYSNY